MMKHLTTLALLCVTVVASAQMEWNTLPKGPYQVGLQTRQMLGSKGDSVLLHIWYPASGRGKQLTFLDIVKLGRGDKADTARVFELRRVVRLLFDVTVPLDELEEMLALPMRATWNAKVAKGKFPLVVAHASPQNYVSTFEFLASHGYVVAGADIKLNRERPSIPYHYTPFTDALEDVFNSVKNLNYVQRENVSVFGHGFGIQPGLYFAMRNPAVRRSVNFDGGFFGPRSNTVQSVDYKPDQLKSPLLHVVTTQQLAIDDPQQFQALKSPVTRVSILSDRFKHQDVSSYGRIARLSSMTSGEDRGTVGKTFSNLHEMLLLFLQDKSPAVPGSESGLLVERFN